MVSPGYQGASDLGAGQGVGGSAMAKGSIVYEWFMSGAGKTRERAQPSGFQKPHRQNPCGG